LFGYNFQGCDVFARTVYGAAGIDHRRMSGRAIAGVLALVIGMAPATSAAGSTRCLSR
jgi:hypothetical protein